MNPEQLSENIGKRVIADHQGIQIVGKLVRMREMFGRTEGEVEFPKGSRPPKRWFYASSIEVSE